MASLVGEGIYMYQRTEAQRKAVENEYNQKLSSGAYVRQHSFLSPKGGYVLFQSGHNFHQEEIEAAKHLANHSYRVELQPEGMRMWASAWCGERSRYAEGIIQGTLYDQKTVSRSATNLSGNVRYAMNHAVDKNAKIALIYDKHGLLHRNNVREGMQAFMNVRANRGKLDSVYVVNSSGRLYIHKLK